MSEALDIDVDSMDELTEEQLDAMSSEQLLELVQALSEDGPTGPEPITNTTAHQVAFARFLRDLSEDMEGEILYSPDGSVPEGYDEEEVFAIFSNNTVEAGRREAWFTVVFESLARQTTEGAEEYKEFVQGHLDEYVEAVQEVSRGSIKNVLSEAGHSVDEIEENPNREDDDDDGGEDEEPAADADIDEAEAE